MFTGNGNSLIGLNVPLHWVAATTQQWNLTIQQELVDFTLGKTFRLTEQQSLRFRADFFNLFNHPSFANPSATDIENPSSFTQITSVVGTPRLIQFSLKYSF